MKFKTKLRYQRTLDDSLRWLGDRSINLFRPSIRHDPAAPDALTCMFNWESLGAAEPTRSTEPDLLADYIQAKRSKGFHQTEWREGVQRGWFEPWEFVGTFGLTAEEVAVIFR